MILTGIPCASTTRCILVLSPFCAAHVLITVFYHANDKNGDEYFSSHHIPVEGLAMESLSVKSKRLH